MAETPDAHEKLREICRIAARIFYEKGFDDKVFRTAKGKGKVKSGWALGVVDVLPRNGRIFFPAKGNIAYNPRGWGGAVSVWINTDPAKLLPPIVNLGSHRQ